MVLKPVNLSSGKVCSMIRTAFILIVFSLVFSHPAYADQRIMIRKDIGVTSANQLSGIVSCAVEDSVALENVTKFFAFNLMELSLVNVTNEELLSLFVVGRCDMISDELQMLESYQEKMKNPGEYIILPETIFK